LSSFSNVHHLFNPDAGMSLIGISTDPISLCWFLSLFPELKRIFVKFHFDFHWNIRLTWMHLRPHLKYTVSNPWNPSPRWSFSVFDEVFHLARSSKHQHEALHLYHESHSDLTSSSQKFHSRQGQGYVIYIRYSWPQKALFCKKKLRYFFGTLLSLNETVRREPQVKCNKGVSSRDWRSICSWFG